MRTLYSSNIGEYVQVTEPGLYIQYRNESGDHDFIFIEKEIYDEHIHDVTCLDHAQAILQVFHSGDWENGEYYAQASHFTTIGLRVQQ